MARVSSTILLLTFILSVSIVPLVEFGHTFLHSFKNTIHQHEVLHKSYAQHSTADHVKFTKMKFADDMNENPTCNNLVLLLYGFCKPLDEFTFAPFNIDLKHNTKAAELSYSVFSVPQAPPPWMFI